MAELDGKTVLEAWLMRRNIEFTAYAKFENNETVIIPIDHAVTALDAQRKVGRYLIKHGYEPSSKWYDKIKDHSTVSDKMVKLVRHYSPKKTEETISE